MGDKILTLNFIRTISTLLFIIVLVYPCNPFFSYKSAPEEMRGVYIVVLLFTMLLAIISSILWRRNQKRQNEVKK